MKKSIYRFLSNERGQVGLMLGILALPVLTAMGGAVDYSNAMVLRQQLQRAIDIGTLAASSAVGDDTQRRAKGEALFGLNYDDSCSSDPLFDFDEGITTGTVSCNVPTYLLGIVGMSTITITSESSVTREPEAVEPNVIADVCVFALSKNARHALQISGSSDIDFNCGLYSRSNHSRSVSVSMSGDLAANSINSVGGYSNNSNGRIDTVFNTGMSFVEDPLADLPAPLEAAAPCDHDSHVYIGAANPVTVYPGVYCGGLMLNTSSKVTYAEGVYIFRGGKFEHSSSGVMVADNVLFYFEDDGYFSIRASGGIYLTGRKTGDHAGFAIVQSNETDEPATDMSISMSGDIHLDGTVYVPRSELFVSMSGRTRYKAGYSSYVADTLKFSVSGNVEVTSDYNGVTPLPQLLKAAMEMPIPKMISRILK